MMNDLYLFGQGDLERIAIHLRRDGNCTPPQGFEVAEGEGARMVYLAKSKVMREETERVIEAAKAKIEEWAEP